ncbi:DUF5906 domain-containing protein [Persephonella sp.]|uniref:DUF5906 domain-containing protein n=1 Tax=Persephonella sp. TaxID=2060922 RepID=UPI0025D6A2E9|nr:DUF5906 domain-containing protein [Persephonella sp.]
MSNNNLTQKEKLSKVKKAFEKGLIVIPSRPNTDGIYKIPIWNGNIKTQKWNYETFKEVVKKSKDWAFGVLTGKQPNGLYLNCLDFDIDRPTQGVHLPIPLLSKILPPEAFEGLEQTQTERFHFFFFTKEELIKPKDAENKGWIKSKKIEKDGKTETIEEPGKIELFTGNKFVACYEGIIKDTDKEPIPLRNLPILDINTVKKLLKTLGFKFEYLTQDERILKEVKKEQEKEIKKDKKENPKLFEIKERIKREINIEDLLYEFSDTFKVINPDHLTRLDCLCPFKPERHPSFKIFRTDNGQFWADFHGYHENIYYPETVKTANIGEAEAVIGDVIDIYRIYTGVDFKQALIDLGQRIGIDKEEIEKAFEGKGNDINTKEILNKVFPNQLIFYDISQSEYFIFNLETNDFYYLSKDQALKKPLKQYLMSKGIEKKYIKDKINDILDNIPCITSTVYEPLNSQKIIDKNGVKYFNLYTPSPFDEHKRTDTLSDIDLNKYPAIKILIDNLTNNDEKKKKYLIQWTAHKIKYKDKIGTAIVIFGEQGAGKGLFANEILRYAIGNKNFGEINDYHLESRFNDWIMGKRLIVANEIKIDYKNNNKAQSLLKMYITDPYITIDRKYKNTIQIENYVDFLIFSNHDDAVRIEPTDRRFFVMRTQNRLVDTISGEILHPEIKEKFKSMSNFVKAIREERDSFIQDLLQLRTDIDFLRYNLHTPEKEEMKRKTMNQLELFIQLIKDQDFITLFENFDLLEFTKSEHIPEEQKIKVLIGIWEILNGFIEASLIPAVYKELMNDKGKSDKGIKDAVSSNFQKIRVRAGGKRRRVSILKNISEDELKVGIDIIYINTDLISLKNKVAEMMFVKGIISENSPEYTESQLPY